ncbi:armadillo-type protein [Hypoxylon sp. FL1284]|nr:armadillo-type protein [Hypoxylon sp. FL1284]
MDEIFPTLESFSRPTTTAELLEKLRLYVDDSPINSPTSARQGSPTEQKSASKHGRSARARQEAAALRALSRSMVRAFCEDPQKLYAVEAALLSPYTDPDDYSNLLKAFVKAITSDSGIPDTRLLDSFSLALRCTHTDRVRKELQPGYGHVIQHLTKKLADAISAADESIQYQLLRALSELLDVMNEVKFKGISDASIAQPLFDILKDLSKHHELRLSESARYAFQALRGIPGDVGPWRKLGMSAYKTLTATAKLAGSISTLDPAKFLECLEAIPQVANIVLVVIPNIIDELKAAASTYKAVASPRRPQQWYLALRYTDFLIRGRAPVLLKSLLETLDLPIQQDKNFLCGLCAQLEQVKLAIDPDNGVVDILGEFLIEQSAKSKSRRVHNWVQVVIPEKKHPNHTNFLIRTSRLIPSWLGEPRTYGTAIKQKELLPQTSRDWNALLSKVWGRCHQFKLFYADQLIRDHYTNEVLQPLKVERVGDNSSLPMAQCYINLAILRSNGEDKNESSIMPSFSLRRRLAILEPHTSNRASLPDLQPKSDLKHGQHRSWRVLIRGQAGMGKSTLCKRIVYDYIYHDMWADIIDRVVWIPLRQLKGQDKSNYTVGQLLYDRYFGRCRDSNLLANSLHYELDKESTKTLFILDGLDEVLHEIPKSNLLRSLLGQRRVIITTRPYALDPNLIKDINMEFQTIGFYAEQVKEYIDAVAPESSVRIQEFLRNRPAIEGLARIPVQLDAFCYSFKEGAFRGSEGPQTITELYTAIVDVMWKKDVVRLGRHFEGRLNEVSKDEAIRSRHAEIQSLVQGEVNALQALAFEGFCNTREEFDWECRERFLERKDKLTEHLPKPRFPVMETEFEKLSLLRTSDGGAATKGSYHFLHLTFQEYFAAQYFVQHWPDRQLSGLKLTAEDFLRKHKYNQRFDIMWRFVAGLLYTKGDGIRFFDMIETEPYDLFGPAHQRLVSRCLAEAAQSKETADFKRLRESRQPYSIILAADPEFPESILRQVLSDRSNRLLRCSILRTLRNRPIISPSLVNQVVDYFDDSDPVLRSEALDVFIRHPDALPDTYHHCIVALLTNTCKMLARSAGFALVAQSVLSDKAARELIKLSNDPETRVYPAVSYIFQRYFGLPRKFLVKIAATIDTARLSNVRSGLPQNIILALLGLLQESSSLNSGDRSDLEKFLGRQPPFPPRIMDNLFGMLRDPHELVRGSATYILAEHSQRDDKHDILDRTMNIFKDPKNNFLHQAEAVLSKRRNLPQSVVQDIGDLLKRPDRQIQSAAARVLGAQEAAFPDAVLQNVVSLMDDPHGCLDATTALSSQDSLPENMLGKLVELLQDPDTQMQASSTDLLGKLVLREPIVDRIVDLFESTNADIRHAAAKALFGGSRSLEVITRKLVMSLWHQQELYQETAIDFLDKQPYVPPELVPEIGNLLKHPAGPIRNLAISILEQQQDLPDDILEEIVSFVEDSAYFNPMAFLRAHLILREQERSLSDKALKRLLRLWSNPDDKYYNKYLESKVIMSRQQELSPQILQDLATQMINNDRNILPSIGNHLARLPDLPDAMVRHICDTLKHPDRICRQAAAETLFNSLAISDEMLASLLSQLDSESFIMLYRHWLKPSFWKHTTWCTDGTDSIISLGGRNRNIPLDKLKHAIREARASLSIPSQIIDQLL